MRKRTAFWIIGLGVSFLLLLNLSVTSKQGINYQVKSIRMPLYIKIMEFMDRDYHYRQLTNSICRKAKTQEAKALALFSWTHRNIARIPKGWLVYDDHVWNIVIRGYGTEDQFCDVFTTLCNYAGIDAFFTWVFTAGRSEKIPLAFVKIENKWRIFDPYPGCYFKDKGGEIADIEDIRSKQDWSLECLSEKPKIDYAVFFANLPSLNEIGLTRANTQSPLKRIRLEIKKYFR